MNSDNVQPWCLLLLIGCSPTTLRIQDPSHCEVNRRQAEMIYDDRLALQPERYRAYGLICAASLFEASGENGPAEDLLKRALSSSESHGDIEIVAVTVRELGQFYARRNNDDETEAAWTRLETIEPQGKSTPNLLSLSVYMMELARTRYESRDYDVAMRLVSRVRSYVGDGFGSVRFADDWIPMLYVKVGRRADGERLHAERIRLARADDNPGEIASELEAYSQFLRLVGERQKAESVSREATDQLRKVRPRVDE